MSRPNFKIVEKSKPNYMDKLDEFIELYNNRLEINTKEICKRLGWTYNVYNSARTYGIEEGLIIPRYESKKAKNYFYSNTRGKYIAQKMIGEKCKKFTCKSEAEAIELVEYLNKTDNWTLENVKKFRKDIYVG